MLPANVLQKGGGMLSGPAVFFFRALMGTFINTSPCEPPPPDAQNAIFLALLCVKDGKGRVLGKIALPPPIMATLPPCDLDRLTPQRLHQILSDASINKFRSDLALYTALSSRIPQFAAFS